MVLIIVCEKIFIIQNHMKVKAFLINTLSLEKLKSSYVAFRQQRDLLQKKMKFRELKMP